MIPVVSVLMPVYNARRYVGEALSSALAQALRELEVVAVDDGSTDGSLAVLERFAADDPRVRVISRPNTGIARALNDALAASRGEFIARIDADDTADPDRLARQVDYLRAHPEAVCVGCMARTIDADGDDLCPWILPETEHEAIDAANLEGRQAMFGSGVTARRAAVVAVGGFREDLEIGEDLDLFLRLAEAGGRLANLPESLMGVRRVGTSITHTRQRRMYEQAAQIVRDARARRGLAGPPPEPPGAESPRTPGQFHRDWGWMALSGGNLRAARKHARRALAARPHEAETWRLAYCAFVRGR